MEIKEATLALAALGQTTRLSIYRRLVEAGHDGSIPGELAEHLSLPGATLSFHLKELVAAGLIHGESRGRSIRYRADFDAMNALVAFLTDHCCGGNPAACAPTAATGASVCAPTVIPLEPSEHSA